jgi:hypothetical protein
MSNFLAVATVTATLKHLLQETANKAVPGSTVTTTRPESMENGTPSPGINAYLYQVIPNAAWRNTDLPTRRADGTLIQRPQTALDLHYLLTFYGNEAQLEPQRLLGSAVSALHARAVFTKEMVQAAIAADANLASSDLADQVETVKFGPLPLNLEELSKLWSAFYQTPYALSVTYRASVVLIEADGTPQSALPVRTPLIYGSPFRQPVIEQVVSQAGPDQPIVAGSTLLIRGQRLSGDVVQVRFGRDEATPASENVNDTQISLSIPTSARAGVQSVQIVHQAMLGEPPTPHRGVESNVAAFVLHPTITGSSISGIQGSGSQSRSADVTVQLAPTVGKEQRVALLLNELSDTEPAAYTFLAAKRESDSDSITIAVTGVKPSAYLVRVQVDGAESSLEIGGDPDDLAFTGPTLFIGDLLRCADIQLNIRPNGNVRARVTVRDENNSPVRDATVSATWTLPGGSSQAQTDDTNSNGRAWFTVSSGDGLYTFTITDIAKADYIFDRGSSVLSQSITK